MLAEPTVDDAETAAPAAERCCDNGTEVHGGVAVPDGTSARWLYPSCGHGRTWGAGGPAMAAAPSPALDVAGRAARLDRHAVVLLAITAVMLYGRHVDRQDRAAAGASLSPTYDGATLGVCKAAVKATQGAVRTTGRRRAPAGTALDRVRALTAAYTVYTWCIQHHVRT